MLRQTPSERSKANRKASVQICPAFFSGSYAKEIGGQRVWLLYSSFSVRCPSSLHSSSRSEERGRGIILGGSSFSCSFSRAYSLDLLPVLRNQDHIYHRVLVVVTLYQRRIRGGYRSSPRRIR